METLGSLTDTPWIYAIIGTSVVLDVFLPVLPSGALVIMAATAVAGTSTAAEAVQGQVSLAAAVDHFPQMLALVLCAATASVLGDMIAFRLAWRGGARLDRAVGRSRRLTIAHERLGVALTTSSGGSIVVLARFAPAGRSVVSLSAGAMHRRVREYLPWSALAGLIWAAYGVTLGFFGGQYLGATWLATALSVGALFLAGLVAVYVVQHPRSSRASTES